MGNMFFGLSNLLSQPMQPGGGGYYRMPGAGMNGGMMPRAPIARPVMPGQPMGMPIQGTMAQPGGFQMPGSPAQPIQGPQFGQPIQAPVNPWQPTGGMPPQMPFAPHPVAPIGPAQPIQGPWGGQQFNMGQPNQQNMMRRPSIGGGY